MSNTFSNITKEYYQSGKIAEESFCKDLMRSEGGIVMPSTKNDDINNHIDLFWIINEKKCSFDVKGARKNSRSDNKVSYDTTWLEFKNVHGNDGSLLGREDYIAFELEDKWAITRRKKLLENLINLITDKQIYSYNPNENFKLYQRSGRQDLIVRVPVSFIEENSVKFITKNS